MYAMYNIIFNSMYFLYEVIEEQIFHYFSFSQPHKKLVFIVIKKMVAFLLVYHLEQ